MTIHSEIITDERTIEHSSLATIEDLAYRATRAEMALRTARVELDLIRRGIGPNYRSIERVIAEIDRALAAGQRMGWSDV